jgi:HEPN domain-containing protein
MDEKVNKWLMIAESDLITARKLVSERILNSIACYHCQQAVEKLLKAFLVSKNKEFGRTHNISKLIDLCADIDKEFLKLIEKGVHKLSVYATELRYPDGFYLPSDEETKDAISKAEYVKDFVMRKLESER